MRLVWAIIASHKHFSFILVMVSLSLHFLYLLRFAQHDYYDSAWFRRFFPKYEYWYILMIRFKWMSCSFNGVEMQLWHRHQHQWLNDNLMYLLRNEKGSASMFVLFGHCQFKYGDWNGFKIEHLGWNGIWS